MKRGAVLVASLLITGTVPADVTGAGDAAILGQLQAQTAKIVEQVKTLRDSLDISKRLEEMEQLRFVKELSEEGKALRGVVSDVKEVKGIAEEQMENPLNYKDVEGQIERLESRMDNAENPEEYAHMIADLERIRMLGQANRESMKKAGSGTDEQEDLKTTAASTMIMSDIMIANEREEAQRRVEERRAMEELWRDNGYSELYEEE